MAEYKYKTKNGEDLFVPGIGQTVKGILTSRIKLENPALELIEENEQAGHLSGTVPQSAQGTTEKDTTEDKEETN